MLWLQGVSTAAEWKSATPRLHSYPNCKSNALRVCCTPVLKAKHKEYLYQVPVCGISHGQTQTRDTNV